LKGMLAAGIAGAANGVMTGFAAVGIDPSHFNLQSGFHNTLAQQGSETSTNGQRTASVQTGASAAGNIPTQSASNAQTNSPPPAIIRVPQEDLKPLNDAVEDCEVCQAKLAVAQGNLSDEKTKFAAATAQRDAAIATARGTFWKRTRTAAKWLVIGAAAGTVLARYH